MKKAEIYKSLIGLTIQSVNVSKGSVILSNGLRCLVSPSSLDELIRNVKIKPTLPILKSNKIMHLRDFLRTNHIDFGYSDKRKGHYRHKFEIGRLDKTVLQKVIDKLNTVEGVKAGIEKLMQSNRFGGKFESSKLIIRTDNRATETFVTI